MMLEVPIRASPRPPWFERARTARSEGRLEEARAACEPHTRDAGLDGARAVGLLGRLAMARGDTHDAATLLSRAVALHAGQRRPVEEADDRFALAYTLATHERRYDDARLALDAEVLGIAGDLTAKRAYYRAVVEHQAGDARRALTLLAEAKERLERQGLAAELVDSADLEALVLFRMGRVAEAKERLLDSDRRFASTTRPCARATRMANLATATLRAHRWAGEPSGSLAPGEALGYAETALSVGDRSCPGGLRHANAQLAIAEASLLMGGLERTRVALDDARAVLPRPARWFLAHWHEVRARLALAHQDFADAAREADVALVSAASPHEVWAIEDLRARALSRLGRREETIVALRSAEAALDDVVATAPLGEGRGTAAALRSSSARTLVEALLDAGDSAGAYEAARRARVRGISSLALVSRLPSLPEETRARLEVGLAAMRRELDADDAESGTSWALPTTELDARAKALESRRAGRRRSLDTLLASAGYERARTVDAAPGTVTLFPFRRDGSLVVFVATARGVNVHEAKGTLSLAQLLGPLVRDIEHASRVRILATGDTLSLALHTLPLGGLPLAARVPTTYALDLSRPDVAEGNGVLLVADPSGNLPYAREEIERAVRFFGDMRRGPVKVLRQGEAVRTSLERAMDGRAILYFAGHALAGGRDGTGSSLALAEGTRLGVPDILRSSRPPTHVILSACEAAREEPSAVASLGVAQAFILAGTRSALAPDVAVADRAAMDLASRVAANLGTGDVAAALAEALREGPPVSPEMLRAFRVIGP